MSLFYNIMFYNNIMIKCLIFYFYAKYHIITVLFTAGNQMLFFTELPHNYEYLIIYKFPCPTWKNYITCIGLSILVIIAPHVALTCVLMDDRTRRYLNATTTQLPAEPHGRETETASSFQRSLALVLNRAVVIEQ